MPSTCLLLKSSATRSNALMNVLCLRASEYYGLYFGFITADSLTRFIFAGGSLFDFGITLLCCFCRLVIFTAHLT